MSATIRRSCMSRGLACPRCANVAMLRGDKLRIGFWDRRPCRACDYARYLNRHRGGRYATDYGSKSARGPRRFPGNVAHPMPPPENDPERFPNYDKGAAERRVDQINEDFKTWAAADAAARAAEREAREAREQNTEPGSFFRAPRHRRWMHARR